MKEQILPPGLCLDLVKNERQVLLQVAKGYVAKCVASRGLDLLARMVEGGQDCRLQIWHLGQICSSSSLTNGQQAERHAVVRQARGVQLLHELLHHHNRLGLAVGHQGGGALGNVGSALLVDRGTFLCEDWVDQKSKHVRVAESWDPCAN